MRTALPYLLAASALFGCKSDKPTMVLDDALVSNRLELLDAELPGCRVGDPQSPPPAVFAGNGSTGTCGGDVAVDFTHESGITDYVVEFIQFCMTSPDGDLIVNGTVDAREVGTPSDSGPVISALEASTDGVVSVERGGETFDIEVTGLRTEYGLPATWAPDWPDETNPDETTIERASIRWSDGTEDYVEGVRYQRTGGLQATVRIFEGKLGREGGDFVVIRTSEAEPLEVDMLGLGIAGGALEIQGAKDTLLVVRPHDEVTGAFDLELDGTPFPDGLDCSGGREPFLQAGLAIINALPVY
jgi:hypothetical protein